MFTRVSHPCLEILARTGSNIYTKHSTIILNQTLPPSQFPSASGVTVTSCTPIFAYLQILPLCIVIAKMKCFINKPTDFLLPEVSWTCVYFCQPSLNFSKGNAWPPPNAGLKQGCIPEEMVLLAEF